MGQLLPAYRNAEPLCFFMAPLDVIDYVFVRELAHAEHPNRGSRFWRLVEQYVPDCEAKNNWLKENGTRLHFPSH